MLRTKAMTSATVTAFILIIGFGFCLAVNLPGHLSYNSVIQLIEGRTGHYSNWHPAVMSWMLGVADGLVRGTALFVVFDAALFFLAMLSLLWGAVRPGWPAAAVGLACLATPQVFLYQGIVWKDVLFADAAVAGFVCLAHAGRLWVRPVWRVLWAIAAVLFLVLAALARQNGIIVLLCGAGALGWIAARQAPGKALRRGLAVGGFAGGAMLLLLAACLWALSLRVIPGEGTAQQIAQLQLYDMTGALAARPDIALPPLGKADPRLVRLMRAQGAKLYSPARNDTLAQSSALLAAMDNAPHTAIAAAWRRLIVHHPLLYLDIRAGVFRWTVLTPDITACVPFVVGVHGSAADLAALHMTTRWDARDGMLDRAALWFVPTPLFSHAAFAAAAIVMIAILLWRRTPPDIAIAFMLIGVLVFALSFFVISLACDYRYLYALDLGVLVAAFYLSLGKPALSGRLR